MTSKENDPLLHRSIDGESNERETDGSGMSTYRLTGGCFAVLLVIAATFVATSFPSSHHFTRSSPPYIQSRLAADTDEATDNFPPPPPPLAEATDDLPPPPPPPPPPAEVFPGVGLPVNEVPAVIPYPSVEQKVGRFFIPAVTQVPPTMIKQPKSTSLKMAEDIFVATQNIGSQIPNVENYNFFSTGSHAKTLQYLLKTNPFMATALTESNGGFDLLTFDPSDPSAKNNPSLYRKIMSTLNGAGHRVNVHFNKHLKITAVRVYDDVLGDRILAQNLDTEYWMSSAIYNLIFYASSVHATIHVLHYCLTAALDYSSEGFGAMNQWAKVYATHVPVKYRQVGEILITDPPNLLALILGEDAKLFLGRDDVPRSLQATFAAITGSSGFGASGTEIRLVLQDMLNMWGANPSNWLEKMMNMTGDTMKKAGILTEFSKHNDLIPQFASDVAGALREIDETKYTAAEVGLKNYLKRCGFTSEINTLEEWIELMSVTGMVHGSTLSYSRAMSHPEILRWRNIQGETWAEADMKLGLTILGTICGMDEHRHVMTSATDSPPDTYTDRLQVVLDEYDAKASELKEAYKNKIMEDEDEFNEFGWILSDFCPDGFDGKQLTITTYI